MQVVQRTVNAGLPMRSGTLRKSYSVLLVTLFLQATACLNEEDVIPDPSESVDDAVGLPDTVAVDGSGSDVAPGDTSAADALDGSAALEPEDVIPDSSGSVDDAVGLPDTVAADGSASDAVVDDTSDAVADDTSDSDALDGSAAPEPVDCALKAGFDRAVRCDNVAQCEGFVDELGCTFFTCPDGTIVPVSLPLFDYFRVPDESCPGGYLPLLAYECPGGWPSIPWDYMPEYWCDGYPHCEPIVVPHPLGGLTVGDEAECSEPIYMCDQWAGITYPYVTYRQVCDGVCDCEYTVDEWVGCADEVAEGCTTHFRCEISGRVLPEERRCNGERDCIFANDDGIVDLSDERGCGPAGPEDGFFRCYDVAGTTIPRFLVCNGSRECPLNGNDEEDCFSCRTDEWPPVTQYELLCNGSPDCGDGSDELCFSCGSGEAVHEDMRCNGWPDCVDSSDESGCTPTP